MQTKWKIPHTDWANSSETTTSPPKFFKYATISLGSGLIFYRVKQNINNTMTICNKTQLNKPTIRRTTYMSRMILMVLTPLTLASWITAWPTALLAPF